MRIGLFQKYGSVTLAPYQYIRDPETPRETLPTLYTVYTIRNMFFKWCRRKQKLEEELVGLDVGDVIDSIVSMEKIFEAEAGVDVPTGDLEEGEGGGGVELVSPSKQPMIIPASSLGPV
jgi:hypothetical protein